MRSNRKVSKKKSKVVLRIGDKVQYISKTLGYGQEFHGLIGHIETIIPENKTYPYQVIFATRVREGSYPCMGIELKKVK